MGGYGNLPSLGIHEVGGVLQREVAMSETEAQQEARVRYDGAFNPMPRRLAFVAGWEAADAKWRAQVNAASRQMESAYQDVARWLDEAEAGGVDAVALAHLRALVEDNLPTIAA